MVNILIYRANKIDSDEWVEGYLVGCYIFTSLTVPQYENKSCNGQQLKISEASMVHIDTNTLSIHFPNMIDKNGKKIFASLSEDGVGGDICIVPEYSVDEKYITVYDYELQMMRIYNIDKQWCDFTSPCRFEVIGIHKG